ncbi:MAG: AAA family ATPase [Gammaproteobacteria bacterium]
MNASQNAPLIRSLQNPALYDHPAQCFEVIETHISWVILTGPYAYKIKKPVDLGFLDFSTLEKRRYYCEEELRLNRRLAPQLYIGLAAITGSPAKPALNGAGPPFEYAVKMAQFPQEAQLDRVMTHGGLRPVHIDSLAQLIAGFHQRIAIAGQDTPYGSPTNVYQPVEENFLHIRPHLTEPASIEQLERLHTWSETENTRLLPLLQQRKADGFIRECHGDMHLANMALLDDQITIFDCLEFNENLRWIDVMSEAAFLMMDLDNRGASTLGWRFLNAYLAANGDYPGLHLLRYYLVYRALVRAKVACIRLGQASLSEEERRAARLQYQRYAGLAESYTQPRATPLIITHGPSGSGKTTHTQRLLETLGAIRVRSDVERKRLFGLNPEARTAAGIGTSLYTADTSHRTYQYLAGLARTIIESGYPAIIDAAFLKRAQRDMFHELAAHLGVPLVILNYHAPEAVLRARITQRAQEGHDASEADIKVFEHQLATFEPITPEESAHALSIHSEHPPEPEKIREFIEIRGKISH